MSRPTGLTSFDTDNALCWRLPVVRVCYKQTLCTNHSVWQQHSIVFLYTFLRVCLLPAVKAAAALYSILVS